jgi:4-hydroxybutyrate CoA-transferase
MTGLPDYQRKIVTARQAVECVRSGDRVYLHWGCACPDVLVQALLQRAGELRNVEIVHLIHLGDAGYTRPEFTGIFHHNALFVGPNAREPVGAGRADFTPVSLSDVERLFTSGDLPLDVAFIQTSPPDVHGFLSLGVGVDTTMTAAACAKYVVAEVNDRMPRALGDCFLHVSRVSAIVETSRPVAELKPAPTDSVQRRVAENVAALIPDGATLQTGIGGIPDGVLACLEDRRDLGIHSEMCSDGVVPLIQAGVINGARKTLHPGKVIVGFVLGTRVLFDFIHENPMFEFHPTAYVNDPYVIARNDNMIAINSAVQVDLTGQVCADSVGTRVISGFGGQLDFIRGAGRSRGGKAIIAMPATARDGAISRIVPTLDPGAGVVTTRSDVQYIVTEYGTAYLRGKTIRQRAEALISIAAPAFRDELYDFAVRVHHLDPRGKVYQKEEIPA